LKIRSRRIFVCSAATPLTVWLPAIASAQDRHPLTALRIVGERFADAVPQAAVDLLDDLKVPRQDAAEQIDRPGFERLRQHGVVGVREGPPRDRP
jgi:hypothetical protein